MTSRTLHRKTPWPALPNGCLAILVCCSLALSWECSASGFAQGPVITVPQFMQSTSSGPHAGVANAGAVAARVAARSSRTAWQGVGCAAFLLAMTLRLVRQTSARGSGKSVRQARDFVVACQARSVAFDGITFPKMRAQNNNQSLSASHQVACSNSMLAASVDSLMDFLLDAPMPLPMRSAARSARIARFAGGARVHIHRHASKARAVGATQRTVRRSVGSKLQQPQRPEVELAPYDSSLVREEIQLGLRTLTRMKSECSREVKSLSTRKGSRMNAGYLSDHRQNILNYVTN